MIAYMRKMWAQIAGTIATLAYSFLTDGSLTGAEVAVFGVQAVGIILVWYSENTAAAPYSKVLSAAYAAGAAVLVLALPGGIDGAEWGQVGFAALTALVVFGIRNKRRAGLGVAAGGGTVAP